MAKTTVKTPELNVSGPLGKVLAFFGKSEQEVFKSGEVVHACVMYAYHVGRANEREGVPVPEEGITEEANLVMAEDALRSFVDRVVLAAREKTARNTYIFEVAMHLFAHGCHPAWPRAREFVEEGEKLGLLP